jgi:hypothetical protein
MPFKKLYFVYGLIIALLAVLYYNFNPTKYSFFPKCPFFVLTGLQCPGCGSQRAIYQLLHGHIAGAIHYNALLVFSLPFLAIHFSYKLLSLVKNKNLKWAVVYHPLTPKVIFVIVCLFWIGRIFSAHH